MQPDRVLRPKRLDQQTARKIGDTRPSMTATPAPAFTSAQARKD